ncbi:hypothetical protein PN466_01760 [Roseofilum reptotaenium CS-1145]|uniref:Cobalt transporter n=1 Tax=Roseofilum reptotaenium AO1-A TaxID=1925591 RepID=A0A1L9QMU0_9CYAN|nr:MULTISPECIES: hypothetical protein [Roseofilum]MBP0030582.1 hypothetical protein [Roseofilum sp. Guam]MDB9515686.1 hypothetical protein [Roseofilum reptotaenium CS-1145]OJJ22735.1 hypothetical protein BI308_18970 [Roseofilum reptotaenium AO1-A]
MKFPYFIGSVMGLAIASTAFFGVSAQACFLSKSPTQGAGENQTSAAPTSDRAEPTSASQIASSTSTHHVHDHTHITDGAKNKPVAMIAGLAGIAGFGAVGMMIKGKDSLPR